MKLIRYIGTKASKSDNVAHTGLVWAPGQVLAATDEVAAKLLAHTTVWSEEPLENTDEKAQAHAEAKAEADPQAGRRTRVLTPAKPV